MQLRTTEAECVHTMKSLNYAAMTDLELAADLERWASVRDRISLRRQHGEGYGGGLSSGNLLEAARRLQAGHEHITQMSREDTNEDDDKIKACPTCRLIHHELVTEAMDEANVS